MSLRSTFWYWCAALTAVLLCHGAGFRSEVRADDPYRDRIVPFVRTYCSECHNNDLAEAELNLLRYDSPEAAAEDFRQWEHVITFVERGEMPPATANRQPSLELRADILKAVREMLDREARATAGDPGRVLPRRLSNAEFDHTIRDLTGVDLRPTRSFPADPAAGEGFDNTGEALSMSPQLFARLYAAAQRVADHALLTTKGITFSPHPVATFADRSQFYEQAILQFYERHQVDYETYLTACWEFRHRSAADRADSIEDWARRRGVSPRYLRSLYELLHSDPSEDRFYVRWLRSRWEEVSAPADATSPSLSAETKRALRDLAQEISALSRSLCPQEGEAIIANAGNGPVDHLARRRQTAAGRNTFDPQTMRPGRRLQQEFRNLDRRPTVRIVLTADSFGSEDKGYVILKNLNFSVDPADKYGPNDNSRSIPLRKLLAEHAPDQLGGLPFGRHPAGGPIDAEACVLAAPGSLEIELPTKAFGESREIRFYVDAELDGPRSESGVLSIVLRDGLTVAASEAAMRSIPVLLVDPDHQIAREVAASGARFCRLFPNRFYFADETRGLSAGFHLIEGYFRDDQPLYELVLAADEQRELDGLWTELEFVTGITEKMLRGFVFFERSERNFLKHRDFDAFREEDPKLVEPDTLSRFERVYLDRSNVKLPVEELGTNPIHIFFEEIRNGLNRRARQMRDAEPAYLRDLEAFARAAYRRPLTSTELTDLRSFFHEVTVAEEHGLEQAVRVSLVRILTSPYVCCRIDAAPGGETVAPLNDFVLASRLSYFLWASMPDAELLALAEAGQLQDERELLAQTRRMLKDERVSDFAREFFGQWLGYRDFLQQESVDRIAFQDFDESLKQAMFEEPTRLAAHLIQHDAPVTALIDSDATFINQRLARHYGLPFDGANDEWALAPGLQDRGRSGVLGMAVFLTKNSQPQRTSPVKRGFWVVHRVLGEHIPAPPADVVALPAKETDTNGKTIRELLAVHVADAKCARCHQRFDAVGLAMEGFDPIGRQRAKDLAGRPVDDVVRLTDGTEAHGVPEFARHLVQDRRGDFVRTFCQKLLGYALGRSLQLSDDVLLAEMQTSLAENGDRFVPLFETVVRSPQFRNQRCRNFSTARFRVQSPGNGR
jgi:hypothetical protein